MQGQADFAQIFTKLICYTAPKIFLLCSSTCELLSSVLHSPLSGHVWWWIYPNLNFTINSDCVEGRSLLSKDIGEKVMTCELLLVNGLVIAIICNQHVAKFFAKLYVIFSGNLPYMLAVCAMLCIPIMLIICAPLVICSGLQLHWKSTKSRFRHGISQYCLCLRSCQSCHSQLSLMGGDQGDLTTKIFVGELYSSALVQDYDIIKSTSLRIKYEYQICYL